MNADITLIAQTTYRRGVRISTPCDSSDLYKAQSMVLNQWRHLIENKDPSDDSFLVEADENGISITFEHVANATDVV